MSTESPHEPSSAERTVQALRESERRLATLLSNLPGIAYRCRNDPDWTMEIVSDGCLDLTGYPASALIGNQQLSYAALIHPDDRAGVWDGVQAAVRQRQPFHLTYRIRTAHGAEKWVWEKGRGVFSAQGELLALEGFITDVTDRHRAEAELRQSEERFRALSDATPEAVVIHRGGMLLEANPALYELFGYARGDLAGCDVLHQLLTPDSAVKAAAHLQESRSGPYEVTGVRKDGQQIPIELRGHVITYQGQPARVTVARDLTAQKRAEALLRAERDRAQNYLDIAAVILMVLDAQGRIRLINKKGCAILGRPECELVGRDWFDEFIPPRERKTVREAFGTLMAGQIEPAEYYQNAIVTAAGEERLIAWHNALLREADGRIIGTLSSGEDITERRRAEHERARLQTRLHESEKLEAIGRLAGGVAHDFNNVLTAILGSTELLRSLSPRDPAIQESLQIIEKAAEHATGVARSLLTFSRHVPADKRPVDLVQTVEDGTRFLRRLLPASIELQLDLLRERPVWVNADATQLNQVVLNLAINARDAMPSGGRLRIAVAVETADAAARGTPGGEARLSISDTGTGIAPELQERIFEPFYTTKPRGLGTGLGLPIVSAIVQDHGGRIDVQSEPGSGSVFTIYLPLTATAAEAPPPAAAAPRAPTGRGETVLVAEDDEAVRQLARTALELLGYAVVVATDGPAILESCRQHQSTLRLLILDYDLPRRNALDCLRDLRAHGLRIPVILMTGSYGDLPQDLGPDVLLLRKPFGVFQLGRLVAELLSRAAAQAAG